MVDLTDRITRYLLARLRRQSIHQVYEAAAEAGLLESAFVDGSQDLGRVWSLPEVVPLTLSGEQTNDRQRVAELLQRLGPTLAVSHDLITPGDDQPRSMPKHRRQQQERADASRQDGKTGRSLSGNASSPATEMYGASSPAAKSEKSIQRVYMLRLLRDLAQPAKVADVAVALLIARAVGATVDGMSKLVEVLRQLDAMIVLKVPVDGFEGRFGVMLEAGLIIRRPAAQVDGFGQKSLSGSYREPPSRVPRMITFGGLDIIQKTDAGVRSALAKACSLADTPIVVADETTGELPTRFTIGADLVVVLEHLDRALIAELLQICCGIAPKAAFAAMNRVDIDPRGLGLDDLVLAIRPGRGVDRIVDTLTLFAEERRREEDEEDGEARKAKPAKTKSTRTAAARAAVQFEVTQPERLASENHENAGRPVPTVETSSGYGDAKSWALDLKSDLALWRQGVLDWSEMSTRLLLSGPPGTGKTTFARALRNTLQVPMIATSVSHWLEPGYLGDVLKAMTAAFDAAKAHSPCLLFVDELDNIGTRGRAGPHSDYWDSLINRMLELLDGASKRDGVIVVGATNHPDRIDPALLRSGRLERHVVIPPPDTDTLTGILAHHLGSDLARVLASRPLPKGISVAPSRGHPETAHGTEPSEPNAAKDAVLKGDHA